jgi:hypothetical protein
MLNHDKFRGAVNQREKLLAALREAPLCLARDPAAGGRPSGRWLAITEIMRLGIAQYNARVFELRRLGHYVDNWREWSDFDGEYHSWFCLVPPEEVEQYRRNRNGKGASHEK